MPTATQKPPQTPLAPRRKPIQQRAKQKSQQILDATARLLEQVGFDDLTTILIAKDIGISVGALYHYFPNKHAILYALGERWLARMSDTLCATEKLDVASMSIATFVSKQLDLMLGVYREQRAILPLAQALWAIPELRELDAQHDDVVISHYKTMYQRLGFRQDDNELERIARLYLETSHALLLSIVDQAPERAAKSLDDLKTLCVSLLSKYHSIDQQ